MDEIFQEEILASTTVLDEITRNDEKRILHQAIKKLPIKQRTAIVLYYYNDMSTREIARVMGCLEGTVKSRLFTARKNLRQALAEEPHVFGKEAAL